MMRYGGGGQLQHTRDILSLCRTLLRQEHQDLVAGFIRKRFQRCNGILTRRFLITDAADQDLFS